MNNKKKVAVISLIVCLVAIISMGSLAWFTADDSIDNTLKFINKFSVEVYETDSDGKPITDPTTGETIGQTYKKLVPGAEIKKDPTVVNKSKKCDQWIRVSVKVDKYSEWKSVVEEGADLSKIFIGYDSAKWTFGEKVEGTDNTVTYTYYLNSLLAPANTATLFTTIKIPENMTIAQAQSIKESHINIKAEAMQKEAGSTVQEAFGKLS